METDDPTRSPELVAAARAGEEGAFEARWSLRAWLYRIATNACLDTLKSEPHRRRRLHFRLNSGRTI